MVRTRAGKVLSVIVIGTSGWQYDDWRGRFYPKELPKRAWLAYFSERIPAVEVNNTFYNLPKPETFEGWREGSAPGFVIGVKASRYITHIRRLREPADSVELLWARCQRLGDKLGPVLFQLPPTLRADLGLLRELLAALPREMRAAVEFRHPSWIDDRVHAELDAAGCALVLADRPRARPPEVVTGGWSYVRFHQGRLAAPGYRSEKLRRWADRIASMDAEEIFVFFNNDPRGAAVRDAEKLSELLRERAAAVRGPGASRAAR